MTDGDGAWGRIDEPRHDGGREWETFVRETPGDPLHHVGSVTAPTAEAAFEHAGRLFPGAETLWLCPTDEVARFSTRRLGGDTDIDTEDDPFGSAFEPTEEGA